MTPEQARAIIEAGRKHDEAMTAAGRYAAQPSWNNAGMPLANFAIPGHSSEATVEMLAGDANGIVWLRTNLRALLDGYASALDEAAHWREARRTAIEGGEILKRELDELRKRLESEERDRTDLIAECDHRQQQINEIADALGDESEWSNLQDRGVNARELAELIVRERDALRVLTTEQAMAIERMLEERRSDERLLTDTAPYQAKQRQEIERLTGELAFTDRSLTAVNDAVAVLRGVIDAGNEAFRQARAEIDRLRNKCNAAADGDAEQMRLQYEARVLSDALRVALDGWSKELTRRHLGGNDETADRTIARLRKLLPTEGPPCTDKTKTKTK